MSLSPRKDPMYFRVALWFAHHPAAVVLGGLMLVMLGYALGSSEKFHG